MSNKYKTRESSKESYLHHKELQDYLFSTARIYAELSSLLDIVLETPQLNTDG